MKKTKAQLFGFSLLLLLLLTPSLYSQSLDQKIDAMASHMYPEDGPGVSILVAKDGEPIYQQAFGLASLELNIPMETKNVFEIGSITKQFTAVAILMLEEQGKLSVNDDILNNMVETFQNEIQVKNGSGRAYRIAAKAGTADGGRNSCSIFDEVHEFNNINLERVHYVLANNTAKTYVHLRWNDKGHLR